jgi:hypothetical protein
MVAVHQLVKFVLGGHDEGEGIGIDLKLGE